MAMNGGRTKSLSTITKLRMNLHNTDNKKDDSVPKSLSYNGGKLFLDGEHIPNATMHDDDKIVWTKQRADGWEHGAFKPNANGLTGVLHSTKSKDKEGIQVVSSVRLEATVIPTIFNCKRGLSPLKLDEKGAPEIGEKKTDDIDFGKLETDLNIPGKDDKDHKIPWVSTQLQLPPMGEADGFNNTVNVKDSKLHVTITIPATFFDYHKQYEDKYKFNFFNCQIGILGDTFDGFCTKYDPSAPEEKGERYYWYGNVVDTPETINSMAIGALEAAPTDATDGTTNRISQPAYDCAEKCNNDLSVMNLLDLTLPNPDDTFMSYMALCVTHEIDSDYRKNILGKSDPDFIGRPDVKKIAEKYSDFFKNDFGIAYLMQGLSTSADLKDDFNEDDKKKLVSYWQGTTKGCLAGKKSFNDVHRELSRIIYINQTAGLQAYLDAGGWAEKVFDAISTKSEIKNMVSVDTFHNGLYHKYVMLLYCLDPDTDYASKLQTKILTYKLQVLQNYFKGSTESIVEDVTKQLSTIMLTKIMNGDATLYGDIQTELSQMKNDLNIQSMADFNIQMNSLMVDVLRSAFFVEKIDGFYGKICGAADKVANKLKLASSGKILAVKVLGKLGIAVGFGFTLFTSISALCNWEHLKPTERAQLIVQTAQYSVNTVKMLFDIGNDLNEYIQTKNYWKTYEVIEMKRLDSEGKVMVESANGIESK